MTFGLQFTNSSGTVILDSQFARLCVICSGRFAPTQESGHGSVTSFPATITTQEPPLVFVRPDTIAGVATIQNTKVLGSAGAWTGFYVRSYDNNYNPTGKYFAAAFRAQPLARFGLRLFGADTSLLFDSDTPAALFTRAVQNWTYVKSVNVQGTVYSNYYSAPFDFSFGDYQLINTHGMDKLCGSIAGRYPSSWWDFPNYTLYTITVGTSNQYDFHLSTLFAKLTS